MNFKISLIILVFLNILSYACAKNAVNYEVLNTPKTETCSIDFNIKINKDFPIKASVKSPQTIFSTELDSEEELPDFYEKFKDEISNCSQSKVEIFTDSPINLKMSSKLISQAKVAKAKMFYLHGEGKIIVRDFSIDNESPSVKSDKPDPLILVIFVDKKGNLKLNNYEMGKIEDLSNLENRLTQVFTDRKHLKVFREGTNEVEKTVYVKISESTSVFDTNFNTLLDLLKKIGASPIQIVLDE